MYRDPGSFVAPLGISFQTGNDLAGQTYNEIWNQAAFGPVFRGETDIDGLPQRSGRFLRTSPSLFSDSNTPARRSTSGSSSPSLFVNVGTLDANFR